MSSPTPAPAPHVPVGDTAAPDVEAVLAALTLDEKVALLDGADFWHLEGVERLGVPQIMVTDGPHGLRKQAEGADHLGLNASVPATCFPPAVSLASSWDPALVRRVGAALGRETRAEGVGVLLGPGVNMKRSPLCGRNFEYFSEDPRLAGEIGAAFVQGVQSEGVGTSLKHYAANNQETERMSISADVDERTLREIYLPAFETVVTRAQPWTVMCSYNRLNGEYASQHRWLLTEVLREQWGFEGLVVSDWGAVDDRAAAVAAGLDLEMPSSGGIGTRRVHAALADGTLTEAEVDLCARRVLQLIARAQPGLQAAPAAPTVDAHHALAREAAAAGMVLLRNEGALLPLAPTGGTVAIVGEFARTPRYQGAGSSQVNPTRLDDALSALTAALPDREVAFAAGFTIDAESAAPADEAALADEAVALAARADVVVAFLGLPASYESEGFDRDHMDLPAGQTALALRLLQANPRLVVVLSNGSVVTLTPWADAVPALLEAWLAGQAGGSALADVLTGAVDPGGRLAETVPAAFTDNPALGNFPGEAGHVRYGEGLLIGYRWYDAHRLPVAFSFGHGLSYTTFDWRDVTIETPDDAATPVVVRLTVVNTGTRTGREVVQVYVSDPASQVYRPEQELAGFAALTLAPGEAREVTIALDRRALSYWHPDLRRWTLEGGEFTVRAAAGSRAVRYEQTVTLDGDVVVAPLAPESPVGAWLDHPVAGPVLREHLGAGILGLVTGAEAAMLRSVPMHRLARFPGSDVTEEQLADWSAAAGA